MDLRKSWRADWTPDGLQISGTTELFPNDFSTAQLQLESEDRTAGVRIYHLAFFRDKEPFCEKDLVGPVYHLDRDFPTDIRLIRVVSPAGIEIGLCAVPRRDAPSNER